jgi:exodeoxyribonuclease VII large subunit
VVYRRSVRYSDAMPPADAKPVTVSRITQALKARIEEHFATVWVQGEIVGFKFHRASGHMYFSLKDDHAIINCAMYRGSNLRLRFSPEDGHKVVVRGGITVYESSGRYQIAVEDMQPQGLGEAELRLRELRDKLRAKGYFAEEFARPIPRYPRVVALVTSASGAAIRDMLELLRQRWPIARVVVKPTQVQGPGAGLAVAASLRQLNELHRTGALKLCATVIGRGGGAREDLAAFNEECVADAIFECTMPVISAVGHETDVSLADLVADYRAETPSAAITHLVPDHMEVLGELLRSEKRFFDAARQCIAVRRQYVEQLSNRPAFRKPFDRVRDHEQRLDELSGRLQRAIKQSLHRAKLRTDGIAEQLDALSPLNILKRGYSLTQRGDRSVVRRAADVAPGEVLRTRVADGEILSRVLKNGEADAE